MPLKINNPFSRCVFYWSRKREAERENSNSKGKKRDRLRLASERRTVEDPKMYPKSRYKQTLRQQPVNDSEFNGAKLAS